MPKHKLISTFSNYVNNYNFLDPIITLKYTHSLNVANFCVDIANTLALSQAEINFAYSLGLLHDIGSFKAWQNKKVILDINESIKVLFDEKLIDKFEVEQNMKKTMKQVLMLHESYENNFPKVLTQVQKLKKAEEKINEIKLYNNILTDADILDLFGMIKRKSLPLIMLPHYKKTSTTKQVLDLFKTEQTIKQDMVKSNVDEVVLILSLFYNLKYDYSKKQALKIDFSTAIYDYFENELSEKEKISLKKIIENFKQKIYYNQANTY